MIGDHQASDWESSLREVTAKVWVILDLQTVDPEGATDFLTTAIDDITVATDDFDQIWYLGDATYGADLEQIEHVANHQVDLLALVNRCKTTG